MDKGLHQLEVIIDRLMPITLLLLLVIILGDIFFADKIQQYHLEDTIKVLDAIIITIFVVDLIFKYERVKNIPAFIRRYWLDIIAVFPFALFFRFFEGFLNIFITEKSLESGQLIFHEGLEIERGASKIAGEAEKVEKEVAKIVREAEETGKVARSSRFGRFIRPLARSPRFLKFHKRLKSAFAFFERPTGKHHIHEQR